MFVAASDLDVEHVAEIGVEFDIAGEAVARGVDFGAWHDTAEHLRTDARALGIEIGADRVARGFARDDLVILVPPLGAERERGVAEAEVEGDRKSVVAGKSGAARVNLGGRRSL